MKTQRFQGGEPRQFYAIVGWRRKNAIPPPPDGRETFVELSVSCILEPANRKFHMHIPS